MPVLVLVLMLMLMLSVPLLPVTKDGCCCGPALALRLAREGGQSLAQVWR